MTSPGFSKILPIPLDSTNRLWLLSDLSASKVQAKQPARRRQMDPAAAAAIILVILGVLGYFAQ